MNERSVGHNLKEIDLKPESVGTWVQRRINELRNPNAPVFNKLGLIGGSHFDFFAPDQVLFPGHNQAGFRLDDPNPYLDVRRLLIELKSEDLPSKISAVDLTMVNYFITNDEVQNVFCRKGIDGVLELMRIAKDRRNKLFYEKDHRGIYSIKGIRNGSACTELTAMAHNLLLLLNVPNAYCVDSFYRSGPNIDSTSQEHNSSKHSFIVLSDSSTKVLSLYDPNDHCLIGGNAEKALKLPLLFPITTQNSQLVGSQLTLQGSMSRLGYEYSLEYKISNFPKVASGIRGLSFWK